MNEIKEILNKLARDPELKKYPHSYNPVIIDKAVSDILSVLLEGEGVPEDRDLISNPPLHDFDDGEVAGYNQACADWREYIKKMMEGKDDNG